MNEISSSKTSRRGFLHRSAAAAAGGVLPSRIGFPAVVSSAGDGDTLRIGLIGCGGRGTGAPMNALSADGNVELTARGDLFEDSPQASLAQLREKMPEKVDVPPDRCFLGFDAYEKLIQSEVDVVLLTTPPGFRPQHLRAVVEAGKHSFVEITAAVDAPGVRSVLASAEAAGKKGLAIVSGFCWRYNDSLRAVLEQIRGGAIGGVRAGLPPH